MENRRTGADIVDGDVIQAQENSFMESGVARRRAGATLCQSKASMSN